jgi:TPP-dependent pyruvate/acetoin dehydrogenase alpha subunit
MTADPQLVQRLYSQLRYVRRVEEEIARIYPSDKIKSPVHLSIGQEAASVGVCDVLRADDIVSGSYRGHATYLAKGGDLNAMMAELYGKATGCASGKGGSMHLVDIAHYILGASAVVGTTISVTAGYALALKREGKGRLAVSFFGDGATEEGAFYECLNFAVLHALPLLFVCENNFFAIHSPQSRRWGAPELLRRVEGFGMPVAQETQSDVLRIRELAADLVERCRQPGSGPAFLEIQCYRWKEHVGPGDDYDAGYRSRADLAPWVDSDPIARLGAQLDSPLRERIDAQIEARIAAAVAFAESSPVPAPEELYTDVFAE